jgi:hypothetical protein
MRVRALGTARAGRRTNLALLALLSLALLTGTVSYAVGTTPATTVATTAHAAVGLAVVLLVPWKRTLVRRGRRRGPHSGRTAGLALAVLVAVTVLAGLAQALAGWSPVAGLAPLQVHVGAALASVPLLVRHLVTHWQPPRAVDLDRHVARRTVVLGGGALGAVAVVDGVARALALPGADDRSTGSTERGSGVPERMPVTQWFTDTVPAAVGGLAVVAAGRTYDVDVSAPGDEVEAVLDCTGGWYAAQRWGGVWVRSLLPAGLPADARSLDVVSVTGYRRRFPLSDAGGLLLATTVAGAPLSAGHGAPRRLVAPGRRGFWWVKWVVRIEVSSAPPWLQPPFPLR